MVMRSWTRSGRWHGNIKTHCFPFLLRRSATRLPIYCSKLPISRVLFEGCILDSSNWEVPSRPTPAPRDKCEGDDGPSGIRAGSRFPGSGFIVQCRLLEDLCDFNGRFCDFASMHSLWQGRESTITPLTSQPTWNYSARSAWMGLILAARLAGIHAAAMVITATA